MMGNYEQLKSAIAAVIKTNGNNEITGALLQQVLIGMTSQIGANMTFRGIATPTTQPATPDQNCFYMATESGVYSNFDGQELDGTKLAIFFNSSGAWRSWLMPIVDFTFDDTPTEDSTNPVTSDGIFKALMQHDDIIFFADVNGTKYEVEYVWNPRVQDWDELMSDTPLEINAGKIYIDHISFDMFTSPYVGAWIQLNALQASTYSGTVMTEQTAIAPTGKISKTASGVTKTYDLPAESGTLARKEETLPNKTYAPLEFSGLGRKYLQKNIVDVSGTDKNVLTQAMLQDGQGNALTNYVFVVQYDYDLNGQTVNVPAGTTLKFEGGSIKNGTLNFGKGVLVESEDVKIFDDVLFTGDCGGQYFHIDWFVANYAQTIAATEPDATEEIQAMFDCGIKKVWLTNKKHYRITSTIVISPDIAIDGQEQKAGFDDVNKYIFGSMDTQLVTFKAASGVVHYNVTVNNLYLYRLQTSGSLTKQNDYKIDIPTLYVDCTEGSIWGFTFKGVLALNKISATVYAADETTSYEYNLGGYTGIEIYAANGKYICYVRLSGYIHDYYRGLNVHKDSGSSWITAIDVNYDSEGVYGGYICTDCSIGGDHQTRSYLPKNDDSFFTVAGISSAEKAYIWDTGYTYNMNDTSLYSTKYSINATRVIGGDRLYDIGSKNRREVKYNLSFNLDGNANLFANLIPNGFYNSISHAGGVLNAKFRVFESDADYEAYIGGDTSKGTAVTKNNTYGYYDLFYPDKLYYDDIQGSPRTSNYARNSYVKDVAVKKILFTCTTAWLDRATIVVFAYSTDISSIVINNGQKEYTYSGSPYFRPVYAPLISTASNDPLTIVITYSTAQTNSDIPYIGICGPGVGNMVGPWGGNVAGALCGVAKGVKLLHHPYFLETKGDGGAPFVQLLHVKKSSTAGILRVEICEREKHFIYVTDTSAQISGNILRSNIEFKVYKKDREVVIQASRVIYATVNSVEVLGVTSDDYYLESVYNDNVDTSTWTLLPIYMSSKSSGTSDRRPAVSTQCVGVTYWDTTLGKMIAWNGTAWVNLDGTALS